MRTLILGASGFVGGYLFKALRRDHTVHGTYSTGALPEADIEHLSLLDVPEVKSLLRRPWDVVVHCAGMVDADACARDPHDAYLINIDGTRNIARYSNARVVFLSTDYVFDGSRHSYTEYDDPNPLSVYGRAKLQAEGSLLD